MHSVRYIVLDKIICGGQYWQTYLIHIQRSHLVEIEYSLINLINECVDDDSSTQPNSLTLSAIFNQDVNSSMTQGWREFHGNSGRFRVCGSRTGAGCCVRKRSANPEAGFLPSTQLGLTIMSHRAYDLGQAHASRRILY